MDTIYLLGAGFSVAANRYLRAEDHGVCGGYPLGTELAERCFDASYEMSLGVEEAFQTALDRPDCRPLCTLVDILQDADYSPGQCAADDPSSSVRRFIAQRPTATYITFNYDCLLEQALFRLNRWNPMDGFGISAEVGLAPNVDTSPLQSCSASKVLHLHGSLYLYAMDSELSRRDASGMQWLTIRDTPKFVFDPDANAGIFMPFERGFQDLHYRKPLERIIAPVRNKAAGLAETYVQVIYEIAEEALHNCQELIAIGYTFGETDRASYMPLLNTFSSPGGRRLNVVAPDATAIIDRIAIEYKTLKFGYFEGTFERWVLAGYPLRGDS